MEDEIWGWPLKLKLCFVFAQIDHSHLVYFGGGGDLEWKGACTDGVSTVWGSWKVRYRPDIENLIKYAVLFVKVDHSGLILMGMTWSGKVHDSNVWGLWKSKIQGWP